MRKIFLIIVLFFVGGLVEASPQIEAFDFNGYSYYRDDLVGWYPSFGVPPANDAEYGVFTSTRPAGNTTGYAIKFTLADSIHMKSIIFDETIVNDWNTGIEDFDAFKISIYDSSVCGSYLCRPEEPFYDWSYTPGHLAWQSDRLVFGDKQYTTYDENGNPIPVIPEWPVQYPDSETKANLKLDKGEYWLSVEWDYQGRSASSYINNFRYSTVPEPATMLLMGGGLAGMFWRRRKVSKLK